MNYRLKKEAVQFFKKDLATTICSLDTWDKYGVDIVALDKVEPCYIDYGHAREGSYKLSSLCGWSKDGSEFHFTIHFPSMQCKEHDVFSKGKVVREMMNKIQNDINHFYENFDTSK